MLKKSYFNKGLFLSTLRRYWPVWFMYLFTLIISLPVGTIGADPTIYQITAGVIINSAWNTGLFLSFIMAACAMVCVFSFMYSSKQAGLIASLPINRSSVYLSSFLAAFSAVTISNIITFIIAIIVELQWGKLEISYLLQWLAIMTLMNITFFGFASFCAMLTSNIVVLPIVYFILSITAYAVDVVARELICNIIYGLTINDTFLIFLSPVAAMASHSPHVYYAYELGYEQPVIIFEKELWIMLGIYSAIGVAFVFLALFIFKRHRMETATDVIAIDFLKPTFKYCMTFGVSLVLTTWMYSFFYDGNYSDSGLFVLLVLSIIGAIIGYFSSLMMIKKTLNVFREKKLGLYISIAIIVCALSICKMDLLNIETNVPNASNVSQVVLNIAGDVATISEKENIQAAIDIHKDIIDNKETYTAKSETSSTIKLSYYLKDGSILSRIYPISDDETGYIPDPLITKCENLLNTKESTTNRTNSFDPTDGTPCECFINYYSKKTDSYETLYLSDKEFLDLYNNAIIPDINEGNIGNVWLKPYGDSYNDMYSIDIYCEIILDEYASNTSATDYLYLTVNKKSINTLNWIIKNTDITPITLKEYNQTVGNNLYRG